MWKTQCELCQGLAWHDVRKAHRMLHQTTASCYKKTRMACVLTTGAAGQFCLTRSALLEESLVEVFLARNPPGDRESACSSVALV